MGYGERPRWDLCQRKGDSVRCLTRFQCQNCWIESPSPRWSRNCGGIALLGPERRGCESVWARCNVVSPRQDGQRSWKLARRLHGASIALGSGTLPTNIRCDSHLKTQTSGGHVSKPLAGKMVNIYGELTMTIF